MKFLREKNDRSILWLITDFRNNEILELVDETGKEYLYRQCGYKPYNGDFTYCMLKAENKRFEIFRIEKVGAELVLCPVLNAKKCEMVSKDIAAASGLYEQLTNNPCAMKESENEKQNKSSEDKSPRKAERLEYIAPKLSRSGKIGIMATLIISYSALLLVGILLVAVPSLSSVISNIGICEEISARAYAITIGLMWTALTPTIGYYFATISPLDFKSRTKIIIACATSVFLIATNIAFFVVINNVNIENLIPIKEFYESDDVWFIPLNMVFGSLGIAICSLLTMFKLDPSKIKDIDNEKCGNGLFEVSKWIVLLIVGLVLKIVKGILKIKEKQPDIFVLVFSILLTWLVFFVAFIFAIIIIALFVTVIIMYLCKFVEFAGADKVDKSSYRLNDGGFNYTLNYFDYDYFHSLERYKDNAGRFWYKVNGDEFIKESDYNP